MISASAQITEFYISKQKGHHTFLTLTDSTFTMSSANKDFKLACLKIYDKSDYSEFEEVSDGYCRFKLPKLKDGVYKVILFVGNQPTGIVTSFIYQGLYIKVKNGSLTFDLQQNVLQNNKEAYDRPYYPSLLLASTANIQSDNSEIIELAQKITKDCETSYEKVRAVHDYVASNIYYDYDAYYSGVYSNTDALSVLHTKRSVCHGYAQLSAALIRALGIPCEVVSGYGLGLSTTGKWNQNNMTGPTNHAWNFAYPDNRLVVFDATWDSDMEYRNKKYDKKDGFRGWRYFDLTPEALSLDHRIVIED